MVSKDHKLSVRRQCALLTLSRSNLYYQPKGESAENLRFMEIIDKQFLETPWYGSRQMARYMKRNDYKCGRHRVRRLVPIYQEPNTSKKHPQHKIWPYLLRNVVIDRPNQVWCSDISVPQQAAREMREKWTPMVFSSGSEASGIPSLSVSAVNGKVTGSHSLAVRVLPRLSTHEIVLGNSLNSMPEVVV